MESIALLRGSALALAVCGIYLLQAAWRLRANNALRLLGGWAAVLASIMVWSFTSAADKGAAFGIVAVVVLVLVYFAWSAFQAERRPFRQSKDREAKQDDIAWQTHLRRVWAGALIGPIAGLSALALSTAVFAMFRMAGMEHTLNLTLVSFGFPIAWAALAVIAGYGASVWKKSTLVLLAGLMPIAYLNFAG